jgi:hypothetical protein
MQPGEFFYEFGIITAVLAVYVLSEILALWLKRWAEAAREKE